MPTISSDRKLQTVITTFEVNPGTCQDLLDELQAACDEVISKRAGVHLGHAACERRADTDRELLAMGNPRGFHVNVKVRRDAGAQPEDQRDVQELRTGDVRRGLLFGVGLVEGPQLGCICLNIY